MFLFSRGVTLTGGPRASLSWAAQITDYVRAHSSLDLMAWTADFGHPLGTVVWNALADDQAGLAAAATELATQDAFLDLVEAGTALIAAPGEDDLVQLVHGSASGEPPAVGSVALVTTATMEVSRVADVMGWSVDMAQHVESLTGNPVTVWSSVYGVMGRMSWIDVFSDVATMEKSTDTINADAGYLERLTATGELFLPGTGHVGRYTRFA